jgi:hypothetical protein
VHVAEIPAENTSAKLSYRELRSTRADGNLSREHFKADVTSRSSIRLGLGSNTFLEQAEQQCTPVSFVVEAPPFRSYSPAAQVAQISHGLKGGG